MTMMKRRRLLSVLPWCLVLLIHTVSATELTRNQLEKIQSAALRTPPKSRIIRGDVADRDRFPYMVRMTNRNLLFCGGTLIAPDVVLTANHCIGSVGALEIGRFNTSDDTETYETHVYETTIRHPRYLQQTQNDVDEFDYSLIKIYDTSKLDISPIALNRNPNLPSTPEQELHVMGWGKPDLESTRPRSNVLMVADVHYIENSRCKDLVSINDGVSLDNRIFNISLCAGDFMERDDSCTGDSGGPIIIASGESGSDLQVGVTSYGFGCAHPELPGIYSRTSYVGDWIDENVCKLSLNPPADFNCDRNGASMEPDLSGELINVSVQVSLTEEEEGDTGWIVQSANEDGVMVTYATQAIGSYNETSSTSTTIQLPNNRAYTFTLFDSYGNGGSGAELRIQENDDLVVLVSTDFEFSTATSFTLGTLPTLSPTASPAPTASEPPSSAPTTFPPASTLRIQFDDYPEEAGWRMEAWVDGSEYVVIEQVFPGTYTNMTTVTEEITLLSIEAVTQYKFTMTDNERDGLCCAGGQGWYQLTLENGEVVAQGSEFQWEESTVFVVESEETSSVSLRRRSWSWGLTSAVCLLQIVTTLL